MIAALFAAARRLDHAEFFELRLGLDRAFAARPVVAAYKRRAVRAHQSRLIGADDFASRHLLERAQYRFVEERSALNDYLFAHLVRVAQLDDLEQSVLDDGIRKPRGYIRDGRAFLLRLFDARIHKHGATRAEVDGRLRAEPDLGELLGVHADSARECFDKAAAARRARLVEQDVGYYAVLDAQAFHVLSAYVEQKLDARQDSVGRGEVRHRLDLAVVEVERGLYQAFAVARDSAVAYVCVVGQKAVDVFYYVDDGGERIARVRAVPGIQKPAVLVDKRDLGRGRARVYAEERRAAVLLDIGERYGDLAMAKPEFRQLLLVVEQRVEPRYFLGVRVLDRFQLVRKLARGKDLFRAVRRAYRVEHLRVFGEYRFFGTERHYEPLSELAQKVQRSAEERHVAAYRLAARKPRYRLIDY